MKVLHSITSTDVGGAQVMLLKYLNGLGSRASDHAVLSLMPHGDVGREIVSLGVPVFSTGLRKGEWSPAAISKFKRAIRDFAPDVVQGWMYHGNLAARLAMVTSLRPIPLVWAVHHSLQDIRNESFSTRQILRVSALLSRGVDAITYCSRASAEQHETIGFNAAKRVLIPNAIDTDEFTPDPDARSRLLALCGIPESRLIIGNVGRDHPMKDQGRMVAAVAQLVEAGFDAHAVFIGKDQEQGHAHRAAQDLAIEDRVSTLGERRDIAALVPGFDIFLLPSAWGEAFPLAVCEAMSAGVPVVTTDVGDSAWIVGDAGLVVAPGSTEAQVAGLTEFAQLDRDTLRARGRDARSRIREIMSIEGYITAHDQLFQAVTTPWALGRLEKPAR